MRRLSSVLETSNCAHILREKGERGGSMSEQTLHCCRADEHDIISAVMDGCDGIILGAETHAGIAPVSTISALQKVCKQAESCVNNDIHQAKLEVRCPVSHRLGPRVQTSCAPGPAYAFQLSQLPPPPPPGGGWVALCRRALAPLHPSKRLPS